MDNRTLSDILPDKYYICTSKSFYNTRMVKGDIIIEKSRNFNINPFKYYNIILATRAAVILYVPKI